MRLLLSLVMLGTTGCATFPADFDRNHAGITVDEAAVNCLDWFWFHESYVSEVAGGLVKTPKGYSCSELFVGNRLHVRYYPSPNWVARLHTHVAPNSQVSKRDKSNVQKDPRLRPSYTRLRNGNVIAYECNVSKKGIKCASRRAR